MAYTLDFDISLGSSKTGLTLNAQIVDTAGGAVGAAITTGFTEIGTGCYLLHCTTVPDAHRGGIKVYAAGVPSTILAFGAINPEEAETVTAINAKTTNLPSDPADQSILLAAINAFTGTGALTYTVTVNDSLGNPLDGVEVWVTTDSAGTNVVAGTLNTNASGQAVFMLDAGTYYLWRQLSGYNFSNPLTIVVS